MVALIQIEDIEDSLGRPADDVLEERRWQSYIDSVSSYIENFVDVGFEMIEDDVIRRKATWEGVIHLPNGPIHAVTAVRNFRTGDIDFYADWDGLDEIFNLEGHQVVDITYTHGYDHIPRDIQLVALGAVLGMINEGDPTELRAFQVGDVREDYRDNFFQGLVGDLGMRTLYKYSETSFTIPASGAMRYPDYKEQGYV